MQHLGRYELGPVVGSGATGTVYRAVLHGPAGFTRPVALKVLEGRGSLTREARLGGLLRHPNLVDVFEVGEIGGRWFCAMELCDRSLAGAGPLPPRAVVDVGLQVCEALAYAHDALGLVHLDLKPANLLLAGTVVKVGDLGIARARGFAHRGGIRGTPGYMAPEQAVGNAVDQRADVYALGVTLVELATGQAPRATTTYDFSGEGPTPVPQAAPAWLAPVSDRCTAEDPEARFASVREVADALRQLGASGDGLADALGLDPRPSTGRSSEGRAELDTLVGRQRELAALLAVLDRPGLVLVHGPPGVGKTHLARAAAARFGEGVCVDLDGIDTVTAVLQALASALGVQAATGPADAQLAQLARALASRGDAVLVLDHVEQVPLAVVVPALLAHAPRLRLVLTAREAPGLGERVFALGVLAPDDAVALLAVRALERGRDVRGDPGLVELARQLDHLPLALELAAGRLGVLDVADLLERLGLALLRSGRADVARGASLERAIATSWDALDADEQRWLSELTVFEGGFTMEAAEAVLSGTPWVLDAIGRLQRRSVVSIVAGRGAVLKPIRAFVEQRRPVDDAVAVRHGRFFAEASQAARVHGPRRHIARRALEPELANLRTAVRRGVARGDLDVATACLAGAWEVLAATGPASLAAELLADVAGVVCTGRHEVERLLVEGGYLSRTGGEPGPPLRRARDLADAAGWTMLAVRARAGLGAIAEITADFDAAEVHFGEALAMLPADRREARALMLGNLATAYLGRRQLDSAHAALLLCLEPMADLESRLMMLGNLGNIAVAQGRHDDAVAVYERALELCERVGNLRQAAIWIGNLATAHRAAGRVDLAEAAYRRALDVARSVGDRRTEGMMIGNLSTLMQADGRLDDARVHMERALAVHREVGAKRSVGIQLANLAMLLKGEGRHAEARAHLVEALAIQEEVADRSRVALVRAGLAQLDVEGGDVAGGLAVLEEVVPTLERTYHSAWLHGLVQLAEARALAGDADGARAALTRLAAETADRTGAARVSVLATTARIHHLLGDHDVARGTLELAAAAASGVELHPASTAARELARAQAAVASPR